MSLASIRIAARLLVVAGLAALTAGCFQPMYAEHTDGTPGLREKLMGVEVPPVDKPNASQEARIQVEIRNALAFKLYGNATGMPPTAPPRRSPKESRPGWRRSSSPAPDPFRHSGAREARTSDVRLHIGESRSITSGFRVHAKARGPE